MVLKDFKQLVALVNKQEKQRIAVAMAQDVDVLLAMDAAQSAGIVDATLIGEQKKLEKIAGELHISLAPYEIVDTTNELECVSQAVKLVLEGHANVLMKGLCSTARFLKGILNKEKGRRHI